MAAAGKRTPTNRTNPGGEEREGGRGEGGREGEEREGGRRDGRKGRMKEKGTDPLKYLSRPADYEGCLYPCKSN